MGRTRIALLLALNPCVAALAAPVGIVNAGFEDLYFGSNLPVVYGGDVPPTAFPVGPAPAGWSIYDPNNVLNAGGFVGVLNPGTLAADGGTFFPGGAAEGDNATLLYVDGEGGGNEYGITQVLNATLTANTVYTLQVAVGNIASGASTVAPFSGFGFYNLDGFPGYRVQLLAGGTLLNQDSGTLIPAEGTFAESTVQFLAGVGHPLIGQALEIRLINRNQMDVPGVRGVEVDFDDVRLDASAVPLPVPAALLLAPLLVLARKRR